MNLSSLAHSIRERVHPWWEARNEREKRVLQLGSVMLALSVAVFGFALPLHERVIEMRDQLPRMAEQAAEAKKMSEFIQQHQHAAKPKGSLMAGVEQASKRWTVRKQLVHLRPVSREQGRQTLELQFQDVSYARFIRFLNAMVERGSEVLFLQLQAAPQAGFVHVRLKLAG
ncbi:MAG: hypothetical protein D6703_06610 [Zetaproteobacteria bacterium]|nr:MAG: hypothetical protein D6703_06610 [Zetaproteobacteria bacterium]